MSQAWQLQRVNHNVKNFGDVARALAIINKNLDAMTTKGGAVLIAGGISINGLQVVSSATQPTVPQTQAILWYNSTDKSLYFCPAGTSIWVVISTEA